MNNFKAETRDNMHNPQDNLFVLSNKIRHTAHTSTLGATDEEHEDYEKRKNHVLKFCDAVEKAYTHTTDETYKKNLFKHLSAADQYIFAIVTRKSWDDIQYASQTLKQTGESCSGFRHTLLIPGVACFSTAFWLAIIKLCVLTANAYLLPAGLILMGIGFILMLGTWPTDVIQATAQMISSVPVPKQNLASPQPSFWSETNHSRTRRPLVRDTSDDASTLNSSTLQLGYTNSGVD